MAQADLVTKFPFGLSSRGMPVIGGGGRETTGNVFFVSSTSSGKSDNINTHGTNTLTPFATLDYAIGACTASNGDIIYLMPGHAESITGPAGIDADVAGITIIGLGNGQNRATFTFSSSTSADMDIDAANILIENVVFDFTGIDGIIAPIDVNSADFTMRNCKVIFSSATAQCPAVVATDTNSSRLWLTNNQFLGGSVAGTNTVVSLIGTVTDIIIENNIFVGAFASAAIQTDGAGVYTNLIIRHNTIVTLGTNQLAIDINGTGSGIIERNSLSGTVLTNLFENATGAANIENYGYDSDTPNQTGTLVPIAGLSIPADSSLLSQIISADFGYNRARYFSVTADFSSATWNTVAAHEIVTVTGAVRVKIIPRCTSSLTAGGAITLILGTETTTNGLILSTDATTIDAGMFWLTATPSHLAAHSSTVPLDFIIANGQDIGYTVGTSAATGGTIIFEVWWDAIDATGSCFAGAGGVL